MEENQNEIDGCNEFGGGDIVIGCNLVNGPKNSQSSILIVAVICEFH